MPIVQYPQLTRVLPHPLERCDCPASCGASSRGAPGRQWEIRGWPPGGPSFCCRVAGASLAGLDVKIPGINADMTVARRY